MKHNIRFSLRARLPSGTRYTWDKYFQTPHEPFNRPLSRSGVTGVERLGQRKTFPRELRLCIVEAVSQ